MSKLFNLLFLSVMIIFFVTAKKTINKKKQDLNKLPAGEYSLVVGVQSLQDCGIPGTGCSSGSQCCSGACNTITGKCA
jgi:hypothetical protein